MTEREHSRNRLCRVCTCYIRTKWSKEHQEYKRLCGCSAPCANCEGTIQLEGPKLIKGRCEDCGTLVHIISKGPIEPISFPGEWQG